MSNVLIKICGVSHEEHVDAAHEGGAQLVGLVLWPNSPRHVPLDRAKELAERARHLGLESVALLVDPDPELVTLCAAFDRIQFHGNEACEQLARSPKPSIRGFGFSPEALRTWTACPYAGWLILDSPRGGSGASFPHEELLPLRTTITKPWLLAGGLTAASVAAAIARLQPHGVDVSSGVERSRGVKDPELIRAFCRAVREA